MIKGIQLKRGESLICDLLEENENNYVMDRPLLMMLVPHETKGHYGIELFPYNPFTDDLRQPLPKDMVASVFDVKVELRNKYALFFGGLQLPDSGMSGILRG